MTQKEMLQILGVELAKKFEQYKADRKDLDRKYAQNLRQYRGIYDPEVLAKIGKDRSHVYPKDTRVKVKGFVAKMMEMLFPASNVNFSVQATPLPELAERHMQAIFDNLQAQAQGQPISDEVIERSIKEFADIRAMAMQTLIRDQTIEYGYADMCKKVIRSAAIYGIGVAKGPIVYTKERRTWEPTVDGAYEPRTELVQLPMHKHVRVWDFYPDLAATAWDDQEGVFERLVFTRSGFERLKTQGFMRDAITQYLKDNRSGNYIELEHDSDVAEDNATSNVSDKLSRKYEAIRYVGYVSGHKMKDIGRSVKDSDLGSSVFVDIWMIDKTIIKAELAPFGDKPSDYYHAFIFGEDEDTGLTGVSLCDDLRDSQLSICASARMTMDNAAVSCGPITETNVDLLEHRNQGAITSFTNIRRKGEGQDAQYPAVREIRVSNHVDTLLKLSQNHERRMDIESNLPSWLFGNTAPLGEAFRTSNNFSTMAGGANMVTKDIVRSFDKFNASVIQSYIDWNMEFGPEDVQGDFEVQPQGVISLVSKEMRGAALDQFMMTLSPEERAMIKTRDLLIARMEARDLDINLVHDRDTAERILQGMHDAQSQTAQTESGLTQAKTAKAQAEAEKIKASIPREEAMAAVNAQRVAAQTEQALADADAKSDNTLLSALDRIENRRPEDAGI